MELHRYAIVHSPDGEEMLVEPALADTLEGVWEVAKAKFPGEKLMFVNTDVDDDGPWLQHLASHPLQNPEGQGGKQP